MSPLIVETKINFNTRIDSVTESQLNIHNFSHVKAKILNNIKRHNSFNVENVF